MDQDIDFIASDILNKKGGQAQFGLIKNFQVNGDVVLVTIRSGIESLAKLIDPLFKSNEYGSQCSFWIYETEWL